MQEGGGGIHMHVCLNRKTENKPIDYIIHGKNHVVNEDVNHKTVTRRNSDCPR